MHFVELFTFSSEFISLSKMFTYESQIKIYTFLCNLCRTTLFIVTSSNIMRGKCMHYNFCVQLKNLGRGESDYAINFSQPVSLKKFMGGVCANLL